MAVRRLAEKQPESFAFTAENRAFAEREIAKYPPGRQASAVIALLWRAQEQAGGWLPRPAIEHVAGVLGMPFIRALEIATFYTMFNLEPVGRHFVQVCGTTPCMLRGAEEIKAVCTSRIGHERHVSADGLFSWAEVECLGACVNAPMVQIGKDYHEDLTAESFAAILDELAAGREPAPGPRIVREFSAPIGGPTTLTDPALFPTQAANDATPVTVVVAPRETAGPAVSDEHKPALMSQARAGGPDDLKLIRGVGPKLEQMLHGMGVFHFDQIAAWSNLNLKWVDQNLGAFKGRAVRDKWIDQAKKLATGWRPTDADGERPE